MKRRGAAKGTGSGYKNLRGFPKDPMVHSQAAKGIKQPQLRTTLGGWHEIGHVKGTGALKKGEFVKSKFTGEPGTVVGTSPFAVKYGQHVRYSNPKFWARGKTSATPQSACPTFHKLSKADKMKVMSKVSQSGLRGMKALEYAEVLSITMQQARGEQRGGKAPADWSATTQKQLDDLRKVQDEMTTSDLQGAVMALAKQEYNVDMSDAANRQRFREVQEKMLNYVTHQEKIVGGLGDNRPDSDFDPVELRKGMHVEEEHTRDTAIAKEIAKDHLTEDKNYYKKLAKMEGRGGKSPANATFKVGSSSARVYPIEGGWAVAYYQSDRNTGHTTVRTKAQALAVARKWRNSEKERLSERDIYLAAIGDAKNRQTERERWGDDDFEDEDQ